MQERLDRKTIEAAARGDEAAFASLVKAYERPIYNLALRMVRLEAEAQDAAQEVFLHLLGALRQYDPGRPFEPWLFRVAANLVLNRLKKCAVKTVSVELLRRRTDPESAPVELPDPCQPCCRRIELEEKHLALHDAIAGLPPGWRAVVTLHYMQSFSVSEIASILGVPVGTVKNRLFRARNALYEKLKDVLETGQGNKL